MISLTGNLSAMTIAPYDKSAEWESLLIGATLCKQVLYGYIIGI